MNAVKLKNSKKHKNYIKYLAQFTKTTLASNCRLINSLKLYKWLTVHFFLLRIRLKTKERTKERRWTVLSK